MFITVHMFGPKEFYVLTVQSCPIKHPKILVISTASQLALMPLHHMKTTHWRPLIPGLQLQPYIQNIVGCSPGIKKKTKTPLFKSPLYSNLRLQSGALFRELRTNGVQRDGDATRRVVSEIVGFPAHALKLARKLTELLPHQAPEWGINKKSPGLLKKKEHGNIKKSLVSFKYFLLRRTTREILWIFLRRFLGSPTIISSTSLCKREEKAWHGADHVGKWWHGLMEIVL